LQRQLKVEGIPSPSVGDLRATIDLLSRPEERGKQYPESWLDQFALTPSTNEYLRKRNLSASTIKEFRLGWDGGKGAITIPLHDRMGHLVGVNRRFMKGEVKYRYPVGFQRSTNLYAYHRVPVRSDLVVVTEGCFDALAFWNIGISAVAIYGSSMTDAQSRLVRSLLPRTVLIATDNDDAGREAAAMVANRLIGLRCSILSYTGKDPGSLTPRRLRSAVVNWRKP